MRIQSCRTIISIGFLSKIKSSINWKDRVYSNIMLWVTYLIAIRTLGVQQIGVRIVIVRVSRKSSSATTATTAAAQSSPFERHSVSSSYLLNQKHRYESKSSTFMRTWWCRKRRRLVGRRSLGLRSQSFRNCQDRVNVTEWFAVSDLTWIGMKIECLASMHRQAWIFGCFLQYTYFLFLKEGERQPPPYLMPPSWHTQTPSRKFMAWGKCCLPSNKNGVSKLAWACFPFVCPPPSSPPPPRLMSIPTFSFLIPLLNCRSWRSSSSRLGPSPCRCNSGRSIWKLVSGSFGRPSFRICHVQRLLTDLSPNSRPFFSHELCQSEIILKKR